VETEQVESELLPEIVDKLEELAKEKKVYRYPDMP